MFSNNFFNDFSPFSNFTSYRNRARPETAYRNDNRTIIINQIINEENNYYCFDCHRQTNILKYFDIKNAVFLCYNCALQHNHLPKEISEVIAGDIRTLELNNLLLLLYGGNKNLIEFIRRYYPLLEKMERNNMYSTIAMDYYRKLIKTKVYNEPEPYMPKKLEGYNSIYRNSIKPSNKINYNNSKNYNEMMDLDDEKMIKNNKNKWKKKEPAVINNEYKDNEDIEMKDDSSKKSEDSTYDDMEGISDKENKTISNNKNKKIENNNIKYQNYKKRENNNFGNKIKKNINDNVNTFTINQLGELSMYPDAKEIDEMD